MFDLLKKKFSNFIGSITKKENEENHLELPQQPNANALETNQEHAGQKASSDTKIAEVRNRNAEVVSKAREYSTHEKEHEKKQMVDTKISEHEVSTVKITYKKEEEGAKEAAEQENRHTQKEREAIHVPKPVGMVDHKKTQLQDKEGKVSNKFVENKEAQKKEVIDVGDSPNKKDDNVVGIKIEHTPKQEERPVGIFERIKEKIAPKEHIHIPEKAVREEVGAKDHHESIPKQIVVERPEIDKEHIEKKTETSHNISLETKIKGFVFGTVEIKDKDVQEILDDFKMALLESDVSYEVAEKIVDTMHRKLVGSKVNSRNIEAEIRTIIRGAISEILKTNSSIDIVQMANAKRNSNKEPFTILFIGPNGAGKTTTMGKIANMMLKNNLTCVLSASDTFRAAAIEQTSIHAQRLGINVVKGTYGADPASIAFDAIAYAKARNIDVVLIDSAGRQETNKNLVEEMKKMVRVAKPDMKIFVGESIAGNALIEQIKTFDAAIKLDGIILTKLDVDAKGGNTISILSETTIPVLFFGMGEAYDSLMPYDQKMILDNIVPI